MFFYNTMGKKYWLFSDMKTGGWVGETLGSFKAQKWLG